MQVQGWRENEQTQECNADKTGRGGPNVPRIAGSTLCTATARPRYRSRPGSEEPASRTRPWSLLLQITDSQDRPPLQEAGMEQTGDDAN